MACGLVNLLTCGGCTRLYKVVTPCTTHDRQPVKILMSQYRTVGLDVNAPAYAQPYGAQPYGIPPYGVPLAYPPIHPHFASYPGNVQLQPWGYGHYPGQLPNPIPHPVATWPDEQAEAQVRSAIAPEVGVVERDAHMATSMCEGRDKSKVVQQKKSYPNKEVSEGVWQFRVEVDREIKQAFAAQTDMTWPEFETEALERFNAHGDMHLGYQVSGDNRGWISLTCSSDWKMAIASVDDGDKGCEHIESTEDTWKREGKREAIPQRRHTPRGYAGSKVPRDPPPQFADTSAMQRTQQVLQVAYILLG
ncbi:hypothetical protein EDB89DRAFT_1909131 [Lactarius sanguifluus]|nr:hypothetical protein EDB89DRAFT_1909131 [Lactarius sanguifluus]